MSSQDIKNTKADNMNCDSQNVNTFEKKEDTHIFSLENNLKKPETTIDKLSYHIKCILELLNENPQRNGLQRTPKRSSISWLELTSGYKQDLKTIVNNATFESQNDDIIIIKDISIFSLCEHHLLPFFGKCHIGYRANDMILGLSKFPRIVDMFSKRLQIQERLGDQISEAISLTLKCQGVIVVIDAQHFCMMMRGINKTESSTITVSSKGCFRYENEQNQFFNMLNGKYR